jgi:hypothetical protein
MTTEDYIYCIHAVQAKYPDAILEYPDKLCSVSAYPGGPEVSRQCDKAKAAWLDAFRHLGAQPHVAKG